MINEEFLMPTAKKPPVVMQRGQGSFVWDEAERRYLDFVQGWAVNALGHCPTELDQALKKQLALLVTASPAYHNRPALELAERLSRASGLCQVTFVLSGAEANETAVKLARKWGRLERSGAYKIVTTEGAFHGRTLSMMAASGKPGWDALFPPLLSLDGAYVRDEDGALVFHALPTPTHEEVAEVARRTALGMKELFKAHHRQSPWDDEAVTTSPTD